MLAFGRTLIYVVEIEIEIEIIPRLHDTTGCQIGWTTAWTTGCIVYTNIQPVVQPSLYNRQPVEQPAASCQQTFNRIDNRGS